ncbi:hypothetical protein HK103_004422 [Boothiomyces macroporosus]|uniref:Protein tyrosine phosphatase n=1 Tax=Boothiomyces macroporosus TaxID=261099 RepID=A0AAD5UKA6_9FUNG|nr:hypothetical protein HK103_004406 [Boothiomyces macroporosus]KAJ3257650.1 hypothetical protein HK103_004422 [Boothiomyces macroporosus]
MNLFKSAKPKIIMYDKLAQEKYLPKWFPDTTKQVGNSYIKNLYKTISDLEQERLENDLSYTIEATKKNEKLNRYYDIVPYDFNRVVLNGTPDYINATHISDMFGNEKYIATQGPLPNTFYSFWQMVWEQKSPVVVMLTPEVEKDRIKCHKYWPETIDQPVEYSGEKSFSVVLKKDSSLMNGQTIHRQFEIEFEGSKRKVEQIQFLGWPDHEGSDAHLVLDVIDYANSVYSTATEMGPFIVHCSAGVGRSGTFCTIDSILKAFENGITDCSKLKKPDWDKVSNCDLVALSVNHLRHQRISMVQSFSQFKLCYEAILLRLHDWNDKGVSVTWNLE